MFAQVNCLVLFLLVAGLQCAPAPGKYIIGFSHGVDGKTNLKTGVNVKADLDGKLVNGTGSAKLGASGSGQVHGSVYVQVNDKIVEASGGYHGSAGGYISPLSKGKLGIDRNGKGVATGNTDWRSDFQHSGAGNAGILTDQDALGEVNEYKNRNAFNILKKMDDLPEY